MRLPSYEVWNEAIANFFYTPAAAGQPAYLQVDRDTLCEIGPHAGVESDLAEEMFVQAVRSKLSTGRANPFVAFLWLDGWRKRARSNPTAPPPFVGLLSICVLAASRMANDPDAGMRSSNYYRRLNKLLGLDYVGKPPSFEKVTELWEELGRWLVELNAGKLGLPTAKAHPTFRHVSYPISQCLLRDADRRKLPDFFRWEGYAPGEEISVGELVPRLRWWASRTTCTLSEQARNILTRGSDSLIQQAVETVAAELKSWDGISVDAAGRSHTSIELRLEVQRGGHRFQCELYPRAPEKFSEGTYETGSRSAYLERLPGTHWFAPLPAVFLEEAFEHGLLLQKSGHVLRFAPSHVIPLEEHAELGGWVSCDRVNTGEKHLVLCHLDYQAQVERYLVEHAEAGWEKTPGSRGLPPSWICFRNVRINAPAAEGVEALACLVPRLRVGIRFVGGLKVGRDTWLKGGEPEVSITVQAGQPVTVYFDNLKVETLPAGSGVLDLASSDLAPGEHEITAGAQSRSFYLCSSGFCTTGTANRDLLGHTLNRDKDVFAPASLSTEVVPPAGEHQPGQLSIVGARVLGSPQDVPSPIREALVLRHGYKRYVVLGRRPGEIVEHDCEFDTPYWFLKRSGALKGRFELAVPFEPQWVIAIGLDRKEFLASIGIPQPPEDTIADETLAADWVRWVGKRYRNLKGKHKLAVWASYREVAARLGNG
jgi:hypothetical protein